MPCVLLLIELCFSECSSFNKAFVLWCCFANRNAEPIEWLKKAQALFLDRMSNLVNNYSFEKVLQWGFSFYFIEEVI